jgi:SAM-dependent methyltransferase
MADFTHSSDSPQFQVEELDVDLRALDQYQNFAYYYDLFYQQQTDDINFYLKLASQMAGHPRILDLACGSGRITLPLLQAGFEVTGLDRSPEMLNLLREKLEQADPELQKRLTLIEGDLTNLDSCLGHEMFDLIIFGFNSFSHLMTSTDQQTCLKSIEDHLKKQGLFVIALCRPNLRQPDDPQRDHYLEHYGTFINPTSQNRVQLFVNTTDYPESQLVRRNFLFYEKLADGSVETTNFPLIARQIYVPEMQAMLKQADFTIKQFYGDYFLNDFNKESEWLLCICTKTLS